MDEPERQLRGVLERHGGIRLALLFGSVAKGTAGFESDLDIAVDAGHTLDVEEKIALIEALAMLTGRPIDLIDLSTVGEPLLGQILAGNKRLIGDNTQYANLMLKHIYNMEDFVPYQRRILEERRRAWIGR
ncbi:MAG: nucleotidyltransferase domain-containing protein [Chlorobiaceae bacterium]|nr:nucleotidyltransferase domain-containing protein [Chlorobiaceae bacterium]